MNGLISQACGSHRPRRPSSLGAVAILIAATLFATVVAGCGKKTDHGELPESRVAVAGSPADPARQFQGDEGPAFRPRGGDGKQSLDPPV